MSGMAIEGVVVEADLGVEHQQPALAGDDQGVDLEKAHVLGDEGLVERRQEGAQLLGRTAGERERLGQRRGVVRPRAGGRIDDEGDDLLGRVVGDLLDVHAALGGGDDRHPAAGSRRPAARGRVRARSPRPPRCRAARPSALRPGLVRHEGHAQHPPGRLAQRLERLDDLDAAALAAAARVDLRLDHPKRSRRASRRRQTASSTLKATTPRGTGTPNSARTCLA